MNLVRLFVLCLLTLCLLILCSCRTTIEKSTSSLPGSETFFSPTEGRVRPSLWWSDIGGEELHILIEKALNNNFSLKIAFERMRQVEALGIISERSYHPTLSTTLSNSTTNSHSSSPAQTTTSKKSWNLGLSCNWEIDLWGRVHAEREAWKNDVLKAHESL